MSEELGPSLKRWTDARVALGRSGGSLPHRALLDFRLSHARARDAVHQAFDPAALALELEPLGLPILLAPSLAPDRASYLQRPDLGRQLSPDGRERLTHQYRPEGFDLALILSDGLSAEAAHRQVPALLAALTLTALAGASWMLVNPIVGAVLGFLAVLAGAAAMVTQPRRTVYQWQVRATYHGAPVTVYTSVDQRVFNQVTRALRRAVEDARPTHADHGLAAA
jgi:hypothetical protein